MSETYTLHYARGGASYTEKCATLTDAIYIAAFGTAEGLIYAKFVTLRGRIVLDNEQLWRRIGDLCSGGSRGGAS